MPRLDFWFEFASTYSYLTTTRIEALARTQGVDVTWRPFLLGPIFRAHGWEGSPFNIYPAKGDYMWRDIERLAGRYDVPFRQPGQFPQNSIKAARIAIAAKDEDWFVPYCKAVFEAEYAHGKIISEDEVLAEIVAGLGQDADAWLARTGDQAVKDALKAQTEEAIERGIFGAPAFTVDDELFWGDDRLEQALEWAAGKRS